MDTEEFFEGENLKHTPISLVVEACVSDFTNAYQAKEDGTFSLVENGQVSCYGLREDEVRSDIQCWVKELQPGNGALTDKVISLVRSNPGWGSIVAGRVIRELRKWAT